MKTLYKRIFALLVCITICVGLLPIFSLQVHADGSSVTQVTTSDGSVWVYTPSGYSSSTKYNVLYILEGLNSTGNDALTSTYQAKLDSLISSGQISPMIAVAVPESTYKTNSLTNVISKIDSTYSTNASGSGRIISGFSQGAYHVWNSIINNPTRKDWANVYIPMSPIGANNELSGNFGQIRNDASRVKIYNTCGDSGAEASYGSYTGVGQMEKIVNNGASYGFVEGTNIFRNQVSGDHSWNTAWTALTTVLPSAVKGTAPANTNNSGDGGAGSDGSWFDIIIGQGNISDGGCTWCSLMMILQNSGTISNTSYQIPHGVHISNLTDSNGLIAKEAFLHSTGAVCSSPSYSNGKISGGGCAYNLASINYASGWSNGSYEGSDRLIYGINGKNFRDMTHAELISCFKVLWNAGYWCHTFVDYKTGNSTGIGAGDHAIALAGVTADDIYFADSAGQQGSIIKWGNILNGSTWYGSSPKIEAVYLYMNPGHSPKDIAGGVAMTPEDGDVVGDDLVDAASRGNGFTEKELSSFMVMGESIEIYNKLTSTDLNSLSQSDRTMLGMWEDNVEDGKFSFNKLIRNIIMAFGIILTVWAMLLYTGFWVDRLNNIVDFSFVNLLTFGKLKVADSDEDSNFGKGQKDTFIGHIDVIKICVISVLFGVLLITGVFYKILFWLIMTVTNLLKRIF